MPPLIHQIANLAAPARGAMRRFCSDLQRPAKIEDCIAKCAELRAEELATISVRGCTGLSDDGEGYLDLPVTGPEEIRIQAGRTG